MDTPSTVRDVPNIWAVVAAYVDENALVLSEALTNDNLRANYPFGRVYDVLIHAIAQKDVHVLARSCALLVDREQYPNAWLLLRQVEAMFKKNASFSDDSTTERQALSSFFQSEAQCRRTNRRLDHFLVNYPDRFEEQFPDLVGAVSIMRKALRHLLGSPEEFIESLPWRLKITPGATAGRARARSLPFLKIAGHICAPAAAHPLIATTLSRLGVDAETPLRYIDAFRNRVMFVPKNYQTKRTIAGEPTHSMPIQLAFDSYGKERLKTLWGIDLSSQLRSQQLARRGSIDGSWSTLDLERASDTVSLSVVTLLFPYRWQQLLCSLRSSMWSIKSPCTNTTAEGVYAKYASMGNGTTFVVETAIFAAACAAVGSRDHVVYGDDICVRARFVPALRRLLRFLGFTVNESKSFHSEASNHVFPFRESCGADWFNGTWVTPIYFRSEPTSYGDVHHMINSMVTMGKPLGQVQQLALSWVADGWFTHIVPYNADTRSGVHVDASTAHDLGLVKTARSVQDLNVLGPHIPFFWGIAPAPARPRVVRGLRSYLLWFFQSTTEDSTLFDGVEDQGKISSLGSYTFSERLARLRMQGVGSTRRLPSALRWLDSLTGAFRQPTITSRVPDLLDRPPSWSERILYVPPSVDAPSSLYFWSQENASLLARKLREARVSRRRAN